MARPCHGRGWAPEKLVLDRFRPRPSGDSRAFGHVFFDEGRQPPRAAHRSGHDGSARAGRRRHLIADGAREQYLDTLSMLAQPDAVRAILGRKTSEFPERLGIQHRTCRLPWPTDWPMRDFSSTTHLPLRSGGFLRKTELLEPVPQSKPRDAEPARSSELIARRELYGLCEKLVLKRSD
jgi:hypothetical protein